MNNPTIEVIIPAYKPGVNLERLIERLEKQSRPVDEIRIINTEKQYWDYGIEERHPNLKVEHIPKEEFDHGRTRGYMVAKSQADYLIFMTQDALPANQSLIDELIQPFLRHEKVKASYARQLPAKDCSFSESFIRSFNYPKNGMYKTKENLPEMGIKTYFCSNVCAAYERETYEKLGGFVQKAIFNEDMIYAAKVIQAGYTIAYAARAQVIHSHNYTCFQQFSRNFDLGVSQADHPEVFLGISSEGEGIRMVKRGIGYLWENKRFLLIPDFICQSIAKYLGYRMGKAYRKLPTSWILKFTSNPDYWKN